MYLINSTYSFKYLANKPLSEHFVIEEKMLKLVYSLNQNEVTQLKTISIVLQEKRKESKAEDEFNNTIWIFVVQALK